MDDFHIDLRRTRFLDDPNSYLERAQHLASSEGEGRRLQLAPLERQFKTAKAILERFRQGQSVLLADDVGLGKTTVAALVAWVVALQGGRVRIYAPNKVMQRRWAEELVRHLPMLKELGAEKKHVKMGAVQRLHPKCIQVTTHHALVVSSRSNQQPTGCDLMVIDEAHRAKGEESAFKRALTALGKYAKRKLILTATPFSIDLKELERLLHFVGAEDIGAVERYAKSLEELYQLGEGRDPGKEAEVLVKAAEDAITALRPYLIRHGVDDLKRSERQCFGEVPDEPWRILTRAASDEDLALLLRMDRILKLTLERAGERRNDPRFHIGWQHLATELERVQSRVQQALPHNQQARREIVEQHVKAATRVLVERRKAAHPKIEAVGEAIRPVIDTGEKVLVFCHHHATAAELLLALERDLKQSPQKVVGPSTTVWWKAWEQVLKFEATDDEREAPYLLFSIIEWLHSPGLRAQAARWIGTPADSVEGLVEQLRATVPRTVVAPAGQGESAPTARTRASRPEMPTIAEAAIALRDRLLDKQSKSTRAVLRNMRSPGTASGLRTSHFPGRLDLGMRVMGAWKDSHDEKTRAARTLYTGEPDIVVEVFNSPFGPDVLVATDRMSEGIDLHRYCRHLIHYELDPSPIRTIQRNGRIRRVGSWASVTGQPIRYAYPMFPGTRDEKAVEVMRQRISAFGLLLGGVPPLHDEEEVEAQKAQRFANEVLRRAEKKLASLNSKLAVTDESPRPRARRL
jgi:ERCC4-related helicase